MIYKYQLSISGDTLYPEKIINKIKGDFIIDSYFSPTDIKPDNNKYGCGEILFWHPKKFSTENNIIEYEKEFIKFIEKNSILFTEEVNSVEIFIEIYYDGGQCNFEIFNKDLLKKLTNFGVSIPLSIYVMEEKEVIEWENQINSNWENN